MNQAATQVDPMDLRIQFDALLNMERKHMDTVKALNFVNKKKDIVEARSVVWIIQHDIAPDSVMIQSRTRFQNY